MKRLIFLTLTLSNIIFANNLNININNNNITGTAYLFIYNNKEYFLKEKKAYKVVKIDLLPERTEILIPNLDMGEYAFTLYADTNSNGMLDKNFMKIPKEPTGFSNNFRPKFKPNYNDFKFTISHDTTQSIDLK
ncbi:MAG: DUF2141 domain-containing protein [Fusobacteriaceae bacterium]